MGNGSLLCPGWVTLIHVGLEGCWILPFADPEMGQLNKSISHRGFGFNFYHPLFFHSELQQLLGCVIWRGHPSRGMDLGPIQEPPWIPPILRPCTLRFVSKSPPRVVESFWPLFHPLAFPSWSLRHSQRPGAAHLSQARAGGTLELLPLPG